MTARVARNLEVVIGDWWLVVGSLITNHQPPATNHHFTTDNPR
jgi:hypothetical protein